MAENEIYLQNFMEIANKSQIVFDICEKNSIISKYGDGMGVYGFDDSIQHYMNFFGINDKFRKELKKTVNGTLNKRKEFKILGAIFFPSHHVSISGLVFDDGYNIYILFAFGTTDINLSDLRMEMIYTHLFNKNGIEEFKTTAIDDEIISWENTMTTGKGFISIGDDPNETLQSLIGDKQIVLCGHSMGCSIALHLGYFISKKNPELFSKIKIVGTAGVQSLREEQYNDSEFMNKRSQIFIYYYCLSPINRFGYIIDCSFFKGRGFCYKYLYLLLDKIIGISIIPVIYNKNANKEITLSKNDNSRFNFNFIFNKNLNLIDERENYECFHGLKKNYIENCKKLFCEQNKNCDFDNMNAEQNSQFNSSEEPVSKNWMVRIGDNINSSKKWTKSLFSTPNKSAETLHSSTESNTNESMNVGSILTSKTDETHDKTDDAATNASANDKILVDKLKENEDLHSILNNKIIQNAGKAKNKAKQKKTQINNVFVKYYLFRQNLVRIHYFIVNYIDG